MLDPEKAMEIAELARVEAKRFFGIPEEIKIHLTATRREENKLAQLYYLDAYLEADLQFDPSQMDSLQECWETIAHEVAHLESREILHAAQLLEKEEHKIFREIQVAIEKLTVRRTRDFLRAHPWREEGTHAE
ncbi:hypothetical protein [Deinococcus cellulosilyticus]|uniref:Uncharacterized protein n=1 Tax=Deinococcus cellulosilyticus (strain DSM 18568 / NBRC 106333 / KACC 11606 / 5516J-15) TaxID=1223518 RepID=A0A511MXL0_DEIC1|nr:hypothetical protein [Deinococcus cellulosilyticus]GEM45324.1 hypothetical protein DC3_09590 [Deinococcus cellulosilyticus NBRC 106333 = KACC 11606]